MHWPLYCTKWYKTYEVITCDMKHINTFIQQQKLEIKQKLSHKLTKFIYNKYRQQ